jgi:hypothetical protein
MAEYADLNMKLTVLTREECIALIDERVREAQLRQAEAYRVAFDRFTKLCTAIAPLFSQTINAFAGAAKTVFEEWEKGLEDTHGDTIVGDDGSRTRVRGVRTGPRL